MSWVIGLLFFKQKTAYEMRISDWSSDVCSSGLGQQRRPARCIGIEGGDVAGGEALEESAHILAGKADQRAIGETGSHTPQVGAHRLEPKGQAGTRRAARIEGAG